MKNEVSIVNESQPVPVESVIRRYGTFIHVLCAVVSITITYYISSTVSAGELRTQVQFNTTKIEAQGRRIDEMNAAFEKVLTKEVFEAHRQNDIARAERMEKMLSRLLEENGRLKH